MNRRADIQVLRALAVLAVIAYHLRPGALRGGFVGVDVFFVISGYLITLHLLRENTQPVVMRLARFYAARARRLLPASATVLVVVAFATPFLLPDTRWRSTAGDLVASAFYVENWALARRSVDYLARDEAPSVLQHFWSLSVEEQFYLIWPILVAMTLGLVARRRMAIRSQGPRTFAGVALLIATCSLTASALYTAHDPARAYFVTFTRVWELAIGAGVAALSVNGTWRALRDRQAAAAQTTGFILIAASSIGIPDTAPYPGTIALIPTVGTALALLGGERSGGDGWARKRWMKPAGWIGDASYSLYLWHWPVIVVLSAHGLVEHWWGATLAVAAAGVLTVLSYRFIESLRSRPLLTRTSTMAAVAVVTSAFVIAQGASLTALVTKAETTARQARDVAVAHLPATGHSAQGSAVGRAGFVPATLIAAEDWSSCATAGVDQSTAPVCVYPTPHPTGTVVVVGDSHVKQWLPALVPAAHQAKLSVTAYIHDSCPFAAGELWRSRELPLPGSYFNACVSWNTLVSRRIQQTSDLRLVVTSSYGNSVTSRPPSPPEDAPEAEGQLAMKLAQALRPTLRRGIPTLQIHDTPRMTRSIPDCVAALGQGALACRAPLRDSQSDQSGATLEASTLLRAGRHGALARYVDLNRYICPAGECRPVVASMLVFRDSNHLTATFARSLLPVVSAAVHTSITARG